MPTPAKRHHAPSSIDFTGLKAEDFAPMQETNLGKVLAKLAALPKEKSNAKRPKRQP